MTLLVDVNVLIALLDGSHVHHVIAHRWFAADGRKAWATCPIVQNGVARIMGNPRYPASPGPPSLIFSQLAAWTADPGHEFWPEDFGLADGPLVDASRILTSQQVTDTYLLALAVRHGGKLATFDRRLATGAVEGGQAALYLVGA